MPKKSKKQMLLDALRGCANDHDTEEAHVDADHLLIAYIGDEDIKKAYEAVPKWYA